MPVQLFADMLLLLLVATHYMNSLTLGLVLNPVANKRHPIPRQVHNLHGQILPHAGDLIELDLATQASDGALLQETHELIAVVPYGLSFTGH